MKRFHQHAEMYAAVFAYLLAGCSMGASSDTSTDPTTAASTALQAAQCDYQDFKATVGACFQAFHECKLAADADLETCRSTLRGCLPPAPDGKGPKGHPGHGGEGEPHERGDCVRADGGVAPDGECGAGSEKQHGKKGKHGGHGGHGGGHPAPDPAAIQACHETLATCIGSNSSDPSQCFAEAEACVRNAFRAPFKVACDNVSPACVNDGGAPSEACKEVKRCCKDGVDGPPASGDGSAQCN